MDEVDKLYNKLKQMDINQLYDDFIEIWKLDDVQKNERKYISKYDSLVLREIENDKVKIKLELSSFYQTHVIPHPCWGNTKDPELIVLALNPSYEPLVDEIETQIYGKEIIETGNPVLKAIDWWDERNYQKYEENRISNLGNSTYSWWKKVVFDGFEPNIEKIGFFNLCGYHSKSYDKIKTKAFKDYEEIKKAFKTITKDNDFIKRVFKDYDNRYLPTQNVLKKYLSYLLIVEKKPVIVIWGYNDWMEFLSFNKYKQQLFSEILIVNENKPFRKDKSQNKRIKYALKINDIVDNKESIIRKILIPKDSQKDN